MKVSSNKCQKKKMDGVKLSVYNSNNQATYGKHHKKKNRQNELIVLHDEA